MKRELQRQYAEMTLGGEAIRAFFPSPLPPVPPLDLTGEREALVERTTLAIGRLDRVDILLPDPQLFLFAYVRKEAVRFQADNHRMQEAGRGAASASQLLSALRERPVCNLNQLYEQTGMTFPTASQAMGRLVELGLARELTGQRRNRVFAYDAYLGILNEGGEPL